jgi:glycosyltransferase involved in cell wall biosynthesis
VADLIQNNQTKNIQYNIIGVPGLGVQHTYYKECVELVTEKNLGKHIHFLGGMSQAQVLPQLQHADVFLNISETGSLDKAILESMSTGVVVVSSNESFVSLLPKELQWLGVYANLSNVGRVIQKVVDLNQVEKNSITQALREIVVHNHGLAGLIGKIKKNLMV